MISDEKKKISLQNWFQIYGRRPFLLVTLAISLFLSIQVAREFTSLKEIQYRTLRQAADIISLGLNQKNRVLVEAVLEALRWQSRAHVVVICSGSRPIIASGPNSQNCEGLKASYTLRKIEIDVSGFGRYRLIAVVPIFGYDFGSVVPFLLSLILIAYFLRILSVLQKRIRLDIINPLEESYLGKEEAVLLFEIENIEKLRRESTDTEVRVAVADAVLARSEQVAHDIKSPLAVLEVALGGSSKISEDQRSQLSLAVKKINDIADDLLKREKRPIALQDICSLTASVVREKKVQFSNLGRIEFELDSNSRDGFAYVNSTEYMRIVSNLVNNSVESMTAGKIVISVLPNEAEVVVKIVDQGKGIPASVLDLLGTRGFSFGKGQGGSGLGLFHAKRTTEGWGGRFSIESEIGSGTTVKMTFPKFSVESLPIGKGVYLLDDDLYNHQVWRMAAKKQGANLVCYSRREELFSELSSIPLSAKIYIDSHLKGDAVRGEEVAKALFDLGYSELYLTTGFSSSGFGQCSWLKDVVGKEPPWAL